MSSNKISVQDKKDLEKFIKFLVLKSSQIIVQSRLFEKIKTECNPHSSSNDWVSFYLVSIMGLCLAISENTPFKIFMTATICKTQVKDKNRVFPSPCLSCLF